ncbi:MAG: Ppx/GppA family phosphatase [Oligoflexia bacterium]|nr:Ppx/GppA family phosphatase [Oligoflexia bacterium]
MKIAAVDLGTNTFLCLIAEVIGQSPTRSLKVIEDVARVVRLGEKVHENRAFLPIALERAARCLTEFQELIKENKVDKVIATATSAARDATNGHKLIQLGRGRGIPIHIIEGRREASLSFAGAVSAVPDAHKRKILVIDVGGGSTELIFSENGNTLKERSFDVGCVRQTEIYLKKDPIDFTEYENMKQVVLKVLKEYGRVDPDLIIAVAGTPTTLACIDQKISFDDSKVEGHVLTKSRIQELAKELGSLTLEERKKVKGLEPLRADVIVAGCALLECGLDVAQQSELRVSTRGLRYGVALNYESFK